MSRSRSTIVGIPHLPELIDVQSTTVCFHHSILAAFIVLQVLFFFNAITHLSRSPKNGVERVGYNVVVAADEDGG